MFTPKELALERGWPGRIEGDRVIQLAAQTLQVYFSGGGRAREHATFTLDEVRLLAPVLHPPSIRVFDTPTRFCFANAAAISGPDASITAPADTSRLDLDPRLVAVIGAEGAISGFTLMNDWVARDLEPPKDRDFATSLGPVVVSPDELDGDQLEVTATVNGGDRSRGGFRISTGNRLSPMRAATPSSAGAISLQARPPRSAAGNRCAPAMSSRLPPSRSGC